MADRGLRAAAVQMTSTTDVAANFAQAGVLIADAARQGAQLVVLPENFSFLGATDADRMAVVEQSGGGPAQDFLAAQAHRHGIWLVGGTIPIAARTDRARSRSLLLNPDGDVAASYDKIHLFDVDVPESPKDSYRESDRTEPGTRPVVAETPLCRIGMSICYDLRFPALFHRLGVLGMNVLVVPAAFTVPTGRVHWQPLLTARAVESLSFVIASGQWGEHAGGRQTWGRSMIIDPWGAELACLETGTGVAVADLDMMRLDRVRRQFPCIDHRREL